MASVSSFEQTIKSPDVTAPDASLPPLSVRISSAFVKDVLDVLLSLALLIVLAPTLLFVAIVIKLETPGPVFFVQERYGVRRRRVGRLVVHEPAKFRLYKFRSMTHQADPSLHEAHIERYLANESLDGAGHARFKLAFDPRVTPVGRIIRRTSIDELPQLFNVLKRDMSLVGPRPVPLYEGAYYLRQAPERFGALPGITGLWQVSGRCDLSAREMLDLDLRYVRQQSLALDAKLLLRTIPAVIGGRGAA
jgi:lipopolysaccharide/colanic/teichoic acid biosynthesis glycosyltransferase